MILNRKPTRLLG